MANSVENKFGAEPFWKPISSAPAEVLVLTKLDDEHGERNVQMMVLRGHRWWADEMYVYYTPTHWAPIGQATGQ